MRNAFEGRKIPWKRSTPESLILRGQWFETNNVQGFIQDAWGGTDIDTCEPHLLGGLGVHVYVHTLRSPDIAVNNIRLTAATGGGNLAGPPGGAGAAPAGVLPRPASGLQHHAAAPL